MGKCEVFPRCTWQKECGEPLEHHLERAGTAFIEAVDRLRRAASMSPNNREVQYQLDLANTMLARYRQALPEVDDLTGRVGAR